MDWPGHWPGLLSLGFPLSYAPERLQASLRLILLRSAVWSGLAAVTLPTVLCPLGRRIKTWFKTDANQGPACQATAARQLESAKHFCPAGEQPAEPRVAPCPGRAGGMRWETTSPPCLSSSNVWVEPARAQRRDHVPQLPGAVRGQRTLRVGHHGRGPRQGKAARVQVPPARLAAGRRPRCGCWGPRLGGWEAGLRLGCGWASPAWSPPACRPWPSVLPPGFAAKPSTHSSAGLVPGAQPSSLTCVRV